MKWVLIIEPSEVDRAYLDRIIGRLGYQLYSAESGEQGLHYVQQSLPSAIIIGERLPDYDPMDLCRSIKEDRIISAPPMLLVSGKADSAYRDKALEVGFTEVVQRPMSIRKFFNKLERCLSNNQRKHIRAPLSIPVMVRRELERLNLQTYNFGEGGMYLKTDDPLPRNTEVGLEFNLPGLRTNFNFNGRIAHASEIPTDETPPGMGIQFLNLAESMKAMLGIYMENHLARPVPAAI